jgi:hypothetical protein
MAIRSARGGGGGEEGGPPCIPYFHAQLVLFSLFFELRNKNKIYVVNPFNHSAGGEAQRGQSS